MPISTIAVPIPAIQFIELAQFLKDQGSNRDPVDAVRIAIDYWIDNASWKQDDLMPEIFTSDKGYKWKEVFLPHDTKIRMKYKGVYHYAQIIGDDFKFGDKSISPSEFANTVANSSRNAWRDLEIRKPEANDWVDANSLRQPNKTFEQIAEESRLLSNKESSK